MKKIKSRKFRIKRKMGVRIWLIILGAFVLFYCGNVKAGMNDSVIKKNRMDGVYAIAEVDGVQRIFYLNMYELNGRVSYCIELGVDITTDIYHSTDDFSVSYLSNEQIDYIRSVSYYGYGYDGHDDYRYYMAAQEIIWEYLGNKGVEWTSELKIDGTRINIDVYKEEIFNLMKLDKGIKIDLNFDNGQVYKVGDEIVITDKNGMLDNYEIVSSLYSDIFINDNNLIIKVGNVIGKEIIELERKEYYDYDSSLYYYDSSQKLISNGNYRDDKEKIYFDIEGVDLNCIIINSYNGANASLGASTLKGAIYEVYDESDNLIGTYELDEKGKFIVSDLTLGKYKIKHIKASEGFIVTKEPLEVIVDKDNMIVKIMQWIIAKEVKITKVYGSDGNYKPEKGVNFLLKGIDSDTTGRLTTNSYGKIELNLLYGTYNVHQLNSTYGYSMVDDFIIDVKNATEEIIYINLVDEMIKVKVKINSLDSASGELLKLDGFSYRIKNKKDDSYLEVDGIDTFTSDNEGNILIPKLLKYGNYIIEQVDVPKGVILNNEALEFSINDNSKLELVDGNFIMEVDFYNELVMGQVNVLSLEEVYYKDINEYGYDVKERENAEFKLYAKDDIVVNGKVLYVGGEEVYTGTSDLDGRLVIDNLYLGSYCLVDIETSDEKCFVLDSCDNKTKVVNVDLEYIKELEKVDITIRNNSSKGDSVVGSIFEIIDDDDIVIYTGITNEEGIVKVEDVMVGNYCIRQKKVSDNYILNEEDLCLLVDSDINIDFTNEVFSKKLISVPDTLSEGIGFYESMIILVLIGTGYFVYKKIFFSKLYR